jgi:hypothetical protein
MPEGFAWQVEMQGSNEWRFGYVNIDGMDSTLRMVSEVASKY